MIAILAPQIAEIPKPFPIISFTVMGGIAVIAILFLRKVKTEIQEIPNVTSQISKDEIINNDKDSTVNKSMD